MQSAPDYPQLTERLAGSPLDPSASEAHGILCGLICAGHPTPEDIWIQELLGTSEEGDLVFQESVRILQALAEHTRGELNGPRLGFTPLLPGEHAPLAERALGLYDWVRGFLYGLGVAGVKAEDLSEQGREAFVDFTNITRMDLDGLDEGEDNEEALAELEEFIWVAAMLIHRERRRSEDKP
jgi:uncharacterized protein YgfB (UPF0149 family)